MSKIEFKHTHILEENYRKDDYFNLDVIIEQYETKLNSIDISSTIGIIAPFGYGKTTFLNQLKNKLDQGSWRINFDAWKYPNREGLWEAFILETVKQIKGDKEQKKLVKQIKGKSTTSKYIDIATDFAALASEKLGGLNILDKFVNIFQKEPITKVYEFQEILGSIFDQVKEQDIYIIIEDIDRSGDAGIFFLETISYFFKNQYTGKKVIVLAPIGSEQRIKNMDSYLKSIDYSRNLNFNELKCGNFIDHLFGEGYFQNRLHEKGQISSFLEGFLKEFSDTTIRLLKKGLRQSILSYTSLTQKYGEAISFRACMIIEFGKLVKNTNGVIYYEQWIKNKQIGRRDSIFSALIYCLIQENQHIRGYLLDNIYHETYREEIDGMINELYTVDNLDIKIVDYKYTDQGAKDTILYFTNNFDRNNDYFGIPNLYFS